MVKIIDFEDKFVDEYLNVYNTAFADSEYSRIGWIQKMSKMKEDYDIIFLALENNKVIGEITLSSEDYDKNDICIDSVTVLPEYRKKGVGSELIKKAEGYVSNKDKHLVCEILDSCDELLNFYKKRGFRLKFIRYRVKTEKELFKFINMQKVNEIREPILKIRTWIILEKR